MTLEEMNIASNAYLELKSVLDEAKKTRGDIKVGVSAPVPKEGELKIIPGTPRIEKVLSERTHIQTTYLRSLTHVKHDSVVYNRFITWLEDSLAVYKTRLVRAGVVFDD